MWKNFFKKFFRWFLHKIFYWVHRHLCRLSFGKRQREKKNETKKRKKNNIDKDDEEEKGTEEE